MARTNHSVIEIFEESEKIKDVGLREFTQLVLCAVPEGSWRMISSYYHHMDDERGEWGNLIHTLRVIRILENLMDMLDVADYNQDVLRSAAILHDSCKHGVNAELVKVQSKAHPFLVADLVAKVGIEYHPLVKACIEQHTGKWGSVPCDWEESGRITLPFILHAADCIEAKLPVVLSV